MSWSQTNLSSTSSSTSWGQLTQQSSQSQNWGQLSPLSTSTSPSTGWGQLTQQSSQSQNWGQLNSSLAQRQVSQVSTNAMNDAASGKGALSVKRHNQQMVQVDQQLDNMVMQVGQNLSNINKTVGEFMQKVWAVNEHVSQYCNAILNRAAKNDPTLGPDDVLKAQGILGFTKLGIDIMQQSSDAAISMAERGLTIFSTQTFNAVEVIFKARMKEVEFFGAKLELFHKQERHELQIVLDMHEAKLKEQAQIFSQFKEILEFESKERDLAHTRSMKEREQSHKEKIDHRSADLEEKKLNNEMIIQTTKEKNRVELTQLEISTKKEVDMTKASLEHDVASKKVELESEVQRYQAKLQKDVEEQRIAADQTARVAEAAASASKCSIM